MHGQTKNIMSPVLCGGGGINSILLSNPHIDNKQAWIPQQIFTFFTNNKESGLNTDYDMQK